MYKAFLSIIFLVLSGPLLAQDPSEEAQVKKAIETFFEGFHARDSVKIKEVVKEGLVLQTIGKKETGEDYLVQDEFPTFLKGIVSIPAENSFREELHSFTVQVDGPLAHVWTPYSFYFNDSFSHCGVNSFQLFKEEGKWKIIYLIDTRRKGGCE